ncbi:serine/threonine-protein kinase [Ideonella sp. DXS29W]|uniref:Serine/threonine-protein kinase n=1 Tax=Ideonella lacteola TaxID=2984193 RepID=A0ABU9BKN0_9BURK
MARLDPDDPPTIGKYRVLRKLGEGATSEVYLAYDDFHERQVAIKRVRAGAGRSEADVHFSSHFFAAEAALVGRLNHPNVVQIHDAVDDPVSPYLVMEYVPGATLRSFCQQDRLLPLEQVVEIGFKCAMALGYVYRQGLIHRDVKPANILAVTDGPEVLDIKLTDFGSVLNLGADRTQIHRVGSLAYMSPEQLEGSTTLDGRADIYSLAAVLYHMIAGRPPFEAESHGALLNMICHAEAEPLTGLREGVSAALDRTIRGALAKSPADRPKDWDEFAHSLSTLITNHEVPRGQLQRVLDSERFNLLRDMEFFSGFGDVELWEVVHRARWQRFPFGHKIFKRGQEGKQFYCIAQGEVEVHRDGERVARLGAGTSVGEMAYLAPSPDLRKHATDVIVSEPCTTVSFNPESLAQLSPDTRHRFDAAFIKVLVRRLHAAHEALAHPRKIM